MSSVGVCDSTFSRQSIPEWRQAGKGPLRDAPAQRMGLPSRSGSDVRPRLLYRVEAGRCNGRRQLNTDQIAGQGQCTWPLRRGKYRLHPGAIAILRIGDDLLVQILLGRVCRETVINRQLLIAELIEVAVRQDSVLRRSSQDGSQGRGRCWELNGGDVLHHTHFDGDSRPRGYK